MSENQENFSKGSLRKALNGEFDFDVKAVLKEGWKITQSDKWAMLQGIAVVFVIALMVVAVAQEVSRQKGIEFNEPSFRMGTELVLMILVAPFAAGLIMMGVNASIGGKNRGSHIFQFVHRTFSIVVASLMISAIVQIGMLLLVLPGLYLIVATGFTIPLILDKGIFPARAIFVSIKVVNVRWYKFVQLYFVFFILTLLVLATFGLAMIWVAPFYYNVKGLLYRDIFGVGVEHRVLYPDITGDSKNNEPLTTSKEDSDLPPMSQKEEGQNVKQQGDKASVNPHKDDYFDA